MEFHIVCALCLAALACSIQPSNALRCYTCSYVAPGDGNKACLEDPSSAGAQLITDCNMKYCMIQRQELTSPRGLVNSFLRGCREKAMNEVVEDPTFKTYTRSCSTELCNSGDGIRSSGAQPDGGYGANMLVPGLPGGGSTLHGGRSTVIVIAGTLALATMRQLLLL